jgi:hypothetical protein
MNFAYEIASNCQCVVHVVSKLKEDKKEDVILVLNEKFTSENKIKLVIR